MTELPEIDATTCKEIAKRINPRFEFLNVRSLEGGMSAQVCALEVNNNGVVEHFVARRHGDYDYELNADVAKHEYNVLSALHELDIKCPKPVLLDESLQLLGRPYLVMELCPGETIMQPADTEHYAVSLAQTLSEIHNSNIDATALTSFVRHEIFARKLLAKQRDIDTEIGDRAIKLEKEIAPILQKGFACSQTNRDVLLHGDFWPGNILWSDNNISAVIDWEDSCVGDPLVDVANCRFELSLMLGRESAEVFTNTYFYNARDLDIDRTGLPHWDLFALYRLGRTIYTWGLEESETIKMQNACDEFAGQAFEQLAR